jgi:hypothetical protein
MITPARQFDAVVVEFFGLSRHFFQWQIGPLAGEQRNWSRHAVLLATYGELLC